MVPLRGYRLETRVEVMLGRRRDVLFGKGREE
jgi:hypothetical protein